MFLHVCDTSKSAKTKTQRHLTKLHFPQVWIFLPASLGKTLAQLQQCQEWVRDSIVGVSIQVHWIVTKKDLTVKSKHPFLGQNVWFPIVLRQQRLSLPVCSGFYLRKNPRLDLQWLSSWGLGHNWHRIVHSHRESRMLCCCLQPSCRKQQHS